MGKANVWYGNSNVNRRVVEYINNYERSYKSRIAIIDKQLMQFEGEEREIIVKTRINQNKFRTVLIKKMVVNVVRVE